MKPKITRLWLGEISGCQEIRVDFSNDYHFAVKIESPQDQEKIARAFFDMAKAIACNPNISDN